MASVIGQISGGIGQIKPTIGQITEFIGKRTQLGSVTELHGARGAARRNRPNGE